jgi:hypothetical protein
MVAFASSCGSARSTFETDETPQDAPGPSPAQGAGSRLTLDVTDIGPAYANKSVYVKLTPGTGECDTSSPTANVFLSKGTVVSGACQIVVEALPKGPYTVCGFIDADEDMQPSPGDLLGQLSLTVAKDAKETWSTDDWIPM